MGAETSQKEPEGASRLEAIDDEEEDLDKYGDDDQGTGLFD
jgi:hypothetical protein